ncbi:helix-turn-helix transcriptional regulator [Fodinicola acaciae]|uniref:helix-turn-helix transcriptional regulator n=1 Tax=Fodinicola acaciae TaxID=2681555 RepID=UPI0013D40229|nr:LuxR family transcriptional regulator [Fodinicola acaciae]
MTTRLIGREDERAELRAAYAAAAQAAVVVLVAGPAGIGKTRLVREFIGDLGDEVLVVEGACRDFGPDRLPYEPFIPVLRRLVRAVGVAEATASLPERGTRGLARLLPEIAREAGQPDPRPDLDPGLGRAWLYEDVLTLLEHRAADRPLLVLLENLHRADRSTSELSTFLADNLSTPGLLLLGTYRPDEVDAAHPLWSVAHGNERVRQITLAGLDRAAVGQQVGELLGQPPDSPTIDRIFQRSEGNPLFIEALVAATEAPAGSLGHLLLGDVDRLGEQSRRIVRAAAVAGSPVHHDLLAAVAAGEGMDDLSLEAALRPLVRRRHFLVVEDGYAFRHELIREAVYGSLLPGERARLHRRCAEAIAANPRLASGHDAPAAIAHHWSAAGEHARAAEAAWHAAESARRAYAYAEQFRMLCRLLQLWHHLPRPRPNPWPSDRVTVMETAAAAALSAGEVAGGFAMTTAALTEIRQPDRAASMLVIRAELADRGGEDPLPDLRNALRLEPAMPVRARVLAAMATVERNQRRSAEAQDHAKQALAIAQQISDRQAEAEALLTLGALAARDAELSTAARLFSRATAAAEDAGAHDTRLLVAATASDALEAAGEHAAAARIARTGITLADELGLARTRGTLLTPNLTESLLSLGQWDDASRINHAALALAPPPLYRAYLHLNQATIGLRRGRVEQVAAIAEQARAAMRGQVRGVESCLEPDLLECRLANANDDRAAAAAIIEHATTTHDLSESPRYGWPLLLAGIQALTRRQHTRRLRDALADWSRRLQVSGRLQQAYAVTVAAHLTGHDAWVAAIAAWRELDQPYTLAETLTAAARAALSARRRTAADDYLTEAATIATTLAARPLLADIDRLAKRARLAVAATPKPSNPAGLTDRELEVLRLLTAGFSNRQIGEHLFISTKTAGVHVSHILAKLSLTTRLEAAAWGHHNNIRATSS